MLIKASCITNLTDARYFAAKDVDFLGFNLEENTEGYLDPMYMKAIREWVEGPLIVGEFSRAPLSYVREAAAFFGLDAVQVPAAAHGAGLSALEGLKVIAAVSGEYPGIDELLQETAPFAQFFLLDISGIIDPATGALPDLERWQKRCADYPILVHADLTAAHWPLLIAALQPAGMNVVGGEEERVGIKSFDEIEEIFDAIEKRDEE
ncbi:MAG: hypothetical protein IT262_03995 [Saprospiraceae bacterium]|nr:hypothetical protein [Saprospiraceae bacterium]